MAVDLVMAREVANAFCAVRPPGHHAERAKAMGFCFFNNIAVAAMHALKAHGLARVAIVDFDVHHGNGTEDCFANNEQVLMVSLFQHPFYPYSGTDHPAPNMLNIPLPGGTDSEVFRQTVTELWLPRLRQFAPEMLFISANAFSEVTQSARAQASSATLQRTSASSQLTVPSSERSATVTAARASSSRPCHAVSTADITKPIVRRFERCNR